MSNLFGVVTMQKSVLSLIAGTLVFIATWLYLNSYYTLTIEDDLLSRETFFVHKLLKPTPQKNKQFVFINTGKDLNLIDDTAGVGNIAVSDRYKLFKLMHAINNTRSKPLYVLLDLQFYYPYNYTLNDSVRKQFATNSAGFYIADKRIDDSLQYEIKQMKNNVAISVLLNSNKIDTPLYKSQYGIADYKTYGSFLNKFKIYYDTLRMGSVPCLMHQRIDGAKYSGNGVLTFCNNRLCFNYLWPDYYYDGDEIKANPNYQEYHLGTLLNLVNNTQARDAIFKDKVVFIGNFEDDVHDTPNARIPGTVVLADIYLSLLNNKHIVPLLWVVFVILVFSILSYIAIYNDLPKIKINLGFAFADNISSFLKEYVSYVSVLLIISILSILVFNITISLFLPAFLFSVMDLIFQKKYKTHHEKD